MQYFQVFVSFRSLWNLAVVDFLASLMVQDSPCLPSLFPSLLSLDPFFSFFHFFPQLDPPKPRGGPWGLPTGGSRVSGGHPSAAPGASGEARWLLILVFLCTRLSALLSLGVFSVSPNNQIS